jgi:hypothetical protein
VGYEGTNDELAALDLHGDVNQFIVSGIGAVSSGLDAPVAAAGGAVFGISLQSALINSGVNPDLASLIAGTGGAGAGSLLAKLRPYLNGRVTWKQLMGNAKSGALVGAISTAAGTAVTKFLKAKYGCSK